ncbi:MAG TPA: hypothetical protein VFW05_17370 [Verrucomicrobiae bacterium]|nr:hypothetical protein [Verrucomicrobiae bacterium]
MITQPDGSDEVRQLFQENVPELAKGVVEIKAIARERGHRSMLVVYSSDGSVDPVGSCVGERGARVRSVVRQLSGETIDVIRWSDSQEELIRNILNPAVIRSVALDEASGRAIVRIVSKQSEDCELDPIRLKLASRVTGWDLQLLDA